MSSQKFTPTNPVDMAKERDWAANLGMMDWDNTSIVFTKRTLLQFLKYTGTTVDTNFSNVSKLPRYAKFGKISDNAASESAEAAAQASVTASEFSQSSDFKPSRRVRTAPGGESHNIFDNEEADDALSKAPPNARAKGQNPTETTDATLAAGTAKVVLDDDDDEYQLNTATGIRPSRRVRSAPGGKDSLAGGLWGDVDEQEFKPTRKVRQVPGGQDSINSLLG